MTLAVGARLGPYEILGPLGAGGMGEVYRARDTRLDRTVAIKVLTSALADDPQLRERFEREARAISSLNHPHICTLFDVGHQDPSTDAGQAVDYLVLEYLDGETLADRLARGTSLDPDEALRIAIDLCDALDRAHRAGIVHRDLKPANVFLARSGSGSAPPIAKLLDFGLAKAAAPVVATTGLSMLPTTPPNLTAQGTILGTFQYMAPEQIEGLEADARTDIFAFGALLFEMVTGRQAFEGKTRASLLGAILKDEPPPVSHVRPVSPRALDRIVRTCLAKDPDDRYQSARDLWRDLKWVASEADRDAAGTIATPVPSRRLAWLLGALGIVAGVTIAFLFLRNSGATAPPRDHVEFTIAAPENVHFGGPPGGGTGVATQLAISPDGQNIVFVAGAQSAYQLWLRPVASVTARPIAGTQGSTFPFWSPDSRFIGFFAGDKLKKVAMAGGPPVVLSDAFPMAGGSWSRDNVILFVRAARSGLVRVTSAGGEPAEVTTLTPGEDQHRWPHFLPDGRHFFYTSITGACCPPPKTGVIRIGSLDPAERAVTLFEGDSSAIYASGHVLFATPDATLMAQPFDPDARRSTGDAFPLAERVSTEGSRYVGASVSTTGTLVYGRGGVIGPQQLTWIDRGGRALGTLGEGGADINLALSPDERQVAVALHTGRGNDRDIWLIDVARNLRSRLTSDSLSDAAPIWSPDGARIAFGSDRDGKASLRQKQTNGTAAEETVFDTPGTASRPCGIRQCQIFPTSWSADGRYILFTLFGSFPASLDIWVMPLFGDRKPFPLFESNFGESFGAFSPDGRWVAYTSDETGQTNVYVRPFLRAGGNYRISRDGGGNPRWRADGKELFFLAADRRMMAASIAATGEFEAATPRVLFEARAVTNVQQQMYAVSSNGQRFLVNERPVNVDAAEPLTVLVNWTAAIRK